MFSSLCLKVFGKQLRLTFVSQARMERNGMWIHFPTPNNFPGPCLSSTFANFSYKSKIQKLFLQLVFASLNLTGMFLPVEHRCYNRDFKISSTILIPPYPGNHLEVFNISSTILIPPSLPSPRKSFGT